MDQDDQQGEGNVNATKMQKLFVDFPRFALLQKLPWIYVPSLMKLTRMSRNTTQTVLSLLGNRLKLLKRVTAGELLHAETMHM